jgi:hypothetical protein
MTSLDGNGASGNPPAVIKGRGIGLRRLTHKQRVELAVDVWSGAKRLSHLSMLQTHAAIPGVSAAEIYQANKRRNNGNGNGGGGGNGAVTA